MKVTSIRSDMIYRRIINSPKDKRNDIYRYELMKPFEFKWKCVGIPLKCESEGGYDVISTSAMGGGYNPSEIDEKNILEVEKIRDDEFWGNCEESILNSLKGFEANGIKLPIQNYIFTILLNDPKNPISVINGDYCGDGGIPGYIIGTIIPNDLSLKMLPVALAHEVNHNVRWQFMQWGTDITLADMILSEGLAENFAALMFGEDKIGMWVKNNSINILENGIKLQIKENLYEKDFNKITSYLYGDEIASIRGIKSIGIPYCAGYSCGYELIKYYLEKTGKNIYEATITPTEEILKETEEFWS
ncbi:DUF2268 domain-containing protein [Paraclostridium ghonii]|uniref:Uncharacterized protein YjaZ n=1 Tax=Paraclostridium ghonii TaxID=29358 RepID=A0ABU0N1W8_9FIRM|nr:DUF2268 domain-containing protein [Paeniclostridium ghonii]MDQ0557161.1 uncharacterized protein YjaZ [Paeniclostridium ghonii]